MAAQDLGIAGQSRFDQLTPGEVALDAAASLVAHPLPEFRIGSDFAKSLGDRRRIVFDQKTGLAMDNDFDQATDTAGDHRKRVVHGEKGGRAETFRPGEIKKGVGLRQIARQIVREEKLNVSETGALFRQIAAFSRVGRSDSHDAESRISGGKIESGSGGSQIDSIVHDIDFVGWYVSGRQLGGDELRDGEEAPGLAIFPSGEQVSGDRKGDAARYNNWSARSQGG